MKARIEGESTVILSEESDDIQSAEYRQRERQLLDKGGLVVLCPSTGLCQSISRPATDYRIFKGPVLTLLDNESLLT